ncbi:hypothetical protein ACFWDG_23145 [Peribacillus sp. NPDC060186]
MESAKDAGYDGIPVPLTFFHIIDYHGGYGFQEKWKFVGKVVEKKADNVVVGEVQAKNSEDDIKVSGIFEEVLP